MEDDYNDIESDNEYSETKDIEDDDAEDDLKDLVIVEEDEVNDL